MPEAAMTVDDIIAVIRGRGGRSTPSRRLVLQALVAEPAGMITAEELTERIQAGHPDVTESTIYRTLSMLEELDLADHVHLGHGPAHWYLKTEPTHWHLTCSRCGTVQNIDPATIAKFAGEIANQAGFRLQPGHFAIAGTCAACQRAH